MKYENHIMITTLVLFLAVALVACTRELPDAIDDQLKDDSHFAALSIAADKLPVNGFYQYQKFTQENDGANVKIKGATDNEQ